MGEQFTLINNLNRPNLVDYSLLQKINDVYQSKPFLTQPQVPSLVQRAGSAVYSLMLDNLFMTLIIVFLIMFLVWCYIEKQRHDAIQEKYLQKLYLKLLKSDKSDNEYFVKDPDPIDIQDLFDEINKNIEVNPLQIEDKPQEQLINSNKKTEEVVNHKTFTNPIQPVVEEKKLIHGIIGSNSGKYMDVGVFTKDSYMLL
jgi:hypothetical protein